MEKLDNISKQGFNLIELIKALLNDTQPILKEANFKFIYEIAKLHSLQNILYYAINHYQKYGYKDVSVDILKQLTKDHQFAITRTAMQDAELELVESKLVENKIKYSVLKGSVMKYLYPSPDMRSMADIDIYFDKTKAKDLRKILTGLGYSVESYKKGNHDTYLKEPFMNIEMHRELVHDAFEYSRYYDDYFEKLEKAENSEYKYLFNDEDFYLYHITHSAKHFSQGGTGIRTVVDHYIYLNCKTLNREYVNEELKKLDLSLYESNLTKLANFWFSNKEVDKKNKDWHYKEEYELMIKMSKFIFSSTTYGSIQHQVLTGFIGEKELKNLKSSKIKRIFKLAFPPYKTMVQIYPVLKKCPILLPFTYVAKIFSIIFKRRKNAMAKLNTATNVTKEQIEEHKKTREEIGIK